MATLANSIRFGAEVDQALADFKRYAAGIAGVNKSLLDLKATSAQVSGAGVSAVSFASAVKDGKQLVGVMQNVNGQFVVARSIVRDLEKTQTDLAQSARGYLLTVKDVARILEATALKGAFGAVTGALEEGAKAAVKFQVGISEIRTISQDNQLTFRQWGKEIKNVSDLLGLPIADVTQATYDAISNQVVKGAEAFEFLAQAGNLARTSQGTLAQSVNALSTILNAYNKSVSESEVISAQFFKAVDLGRFTLAEFSGAAARVIPLASSLGVTFEDVAAAMSVLTVQGIDAGTSSTLLTNVFQKLLRPTERMQAVIRSFGVETSQAAIQTFGFGGVLQKLITLAKNGDADVGELFNEIRGRKGFEALANFQDQFKNNLGQITNSLNDYRKAVDIRGESPADFLIKEVNKLKNTVNAEFGQPLIDLTARVVKSLQEVSPEFAIIREAGTAGARTLAVYAAATLGVAAAVRVLNKEFLVTKALNPFTILTAGVVLYGSQLLKAYDNTVTLSAGLQRIADQEKDRQRAAQTGESGGNAGFEAIKNNAEQTYQTILQSVARASIGVSGNLETIRQKTGIINESLKLGFKSYFDQLNNAVSLTESKINTVRNNLKAIGDSGAILKKAVEDTVFQSQLQFATPQQQSALIGQRITKLRQEADALAVKTGDPERDAQNIQLIDQKLAEAVQLVNQDYNIRVGILQENARLAGGIQQIQVDSLATNQQLNAILTQRTSINERLKKQQEEELARLEKEKQDKRDKAAQVQAAAKDFENFNFLDKGGNVKKEFRDPLSGNFNPERGLAEFNAIAERLRVAIGDDAGAQINLLNLVDAKKTTILKEGEALRLKLQIEAAQTSLNNQRKFAADQVTEQNKIAGAAASKAFGKGGALDLLAEQNDAVKQFRGENVTVRDVLNARVRDLGVEAKSGFTNAPKTNEAQLNRVATAQQRLDAALAQFQEAQRIARQNADNINGFSAARPQDIKALEDSVTVLQRTLIDLVVAKEGNVADPLGAALKTKTGDNVPIRALIADLLKQVEELKTARTQVLTAEGTKNATALGVKRLENDPILQQLKDRFPEIANDVEKQAPRIQTAFSGINNAVQGTIDTVKALQVELNKLNIDKLQLLGPLRERGVDGPEPVFKASGGVIGYHPGAPRGTDTVPAWLTPGERVLSVAQNRQYERMTTLLKPFATQARYYSQGGVVSTTVGDIHISVSGAKGAQPLEHIARGLRRGIKRGSIKLT